jgi:hypothetical protein
MNIAAMIKIEHLALFAKKLKSSYKETSEFFDRYHVWEFIDNAYEGLACTGAAGNPRRHQRLYKEFRFPVWQVNPNASSSITPVTG